VCLRLFSRGKSIECACIVCIMVNLEIASDPTSSSEHSSKHRTCKLSPHVAPRSLSAHDQFPLLDHIPTLHHHPVPSFGLGSTYFVISWRYPLVLPSSRNPHARVVLHVRARVPEKQARRPATASHNLHVRAESATRRRRSRTTYWRSPLHKRETLRAR
jgi:hypothetical protein